MSQRTTTECPRSVPSCVRCRRLKAKCDRKLPSCSRCLAAGSFCKGFNSVHDTQVPRSLVQYLEQEIARVERDLAEMGYQDTDIHTPTPMAAPIPAPSGCPGTAAATRSSQQAAAASTATSAVIETGQQATEAQPTHSPASSTDHGDGSFPWDEIRDAVVSSGELQGMISATIPEGPSLTDIGRVQMCLTPSLVLKSSPSCSSSSSSSSSVSAMPSTAAAGQQQQQQQQPLPHRRTSSIRSQSLCGGSSGGDEVDISVLASIPTHIIYSLVKKYVQRMLPVQPFLYEPEVWERLDRVLRQVLQRGSMPEAAGDGHTARPRPLPLVSAVEGNYDFLVIYLILAVSSTLGSAEVGQAARCLVFSESLFNEGIRHFAQPNRRPSDMARIQVTLLILQYVSINPKMGNVWILSGLAMRDCLELGYHRDMPETRTLDPLTVDLRRRIFWAAYCMDRSICAAIQHPFSIPDPAIDVPVMSILPDKCITSVGLVDHGSQPSKGLALRWIEYRQLQSHIIEVHFQGRALDPGQSWEDWLACTEQRLWNWYNSDLPHDHWTEFVLFHGLVMLHRPSRRMPRPASSSLFAAFEAATASARCCREQIVFGYFPRPWLAAHHMFATSLVVLFCLRNDYDTIARKYSPSEIFEKTKMFTTNLLTICAQGWSEISAFAGIYERLLAPLMESILLQSKPVHEAYTPEQDSDLLALLYPGIDYRGEIKPAGLTHVSDLADAELNLSPFDVTIFSRDDQFISGERGSLLFL